jgi:Fuc2NAc and GlcNAc transferase
MIKKSLVAVVNERSSHTVPTPHGGGIALAITWFIGLFYLYFIGEISSNLFYALLFGAVISIVSFFDDMYELSPKIRLIAQSIVAIGGLYFLGGFETLTFGIFDIQNHIFTNIFAFFMIIWFINLYNFLDGINGYAGSEAVFLAFAGFILFGGNHFLVLAVAVLGFLYWNYNKAKIFMGDVGSTLLGYNVAIFTLYYANQESTDFWIWIILFSLFWFDATVTLIRRKLNGEKLSQAHKKHAYQRLTQAKWSHFKVTNYAMIMNILLFGIVVMVSNIFISLIIALMLLLSIMLFIDKKKVFK